jgi:hypothetical protein
VGADHERCRDETCGGERGHGVEGGKVSKEAK